MEITKQEFNDFCQEMRSFKDSVSAGFAALVQRLDQTNERLNQTNERLDQTNERLDQTNANLSEFRQQMNVKLDGISRFLLSSERSDEKLESRVDKLEQRVDRLDNQGPAA